MTPGRHDNQVMIVKDLPNGGQVVIYDNGHKIYTLNGKHHNEDGPAEEDADGRKIWFLNGVQYFPKDNEEWLRIMKMKALL